MLVSSVERCRTVATSLRLKAVLTHTARLLVVVAATCISVFAQGVTGTIAGIVKDAQAAVVPGATVTLISETQGTQMAPVVTNATGDFVIPNVPAGTYTVQVEMTSFRTLRLSGVAVSPGARLVLPPMTIEVGGASEQLVVTAEAPLIQAASGEKSFTVATESVSSLPLANRSYDALLGLVPGVNSTPGALTPASRLGGGGDSNFMLDGATAMDPGVNRPAMRVSVEAISEVRVATSTYQAEYGRSSGLQVNAVTKSGTNQFRGAVYDVERNSKWNTNSQTNILNGDPKAFQDERDWGFAIGGPVGRPGGNNKLFFYYNQEFNPRTFGNTVNRYRMPTLLERQGDFSQSTDNLGNPYPFVKDPQLAGACNATTQAGCFRDGGVLGRIPRDRLYQTGLNILKWWPEPNITNVPAGQAYNFENTDAPISLLGYQPVLRVDYQPFRNLRGSFKYLEYQQPSKIIPGTLPGFNDSREDNYGIWVPAATVNWSVNPTTFVEASWGANYHHQEGCSVVGGSPNWCRSALPVGASANRATAGFGDIPYLFPDANILDPGTFSYEVVSRSGSPVWDGTRVQAAPAFNWGNRIANAPPNNSDPWGNFILDTASGNFNATLTRVQGRHTLKTGYYYFKSYQRRGQGAFIGTINFQQDTVGTNPCDTSFGFANAAIGCFSSYAQQSRWGEGAYTAINHEGFVQDNWKLTSNLTLDYGLRLVHQVPQYDAYLKASNFLPETWKSSDAPRLYVAGCANGANPCTGANRQAMNPVTGQFLGANSTLAIGTLVPDTGNRTNGIFPAGQGIAKENGEYPALAAAPRVGAAWDVTGTQRYVVRGGAGLFFDRPQAQNVYNTVNNPPFTRNVTVRYGQLQNLSSAGLTTEATPALTVWQYDMPLPSSTQWNAGVQTVIPFSSTLDVSYTGQHSYGTPTAVNINAIDIGAAFLPQYADPTQPTQSVATSYVATAPDLVRFYRGYGSISQQQTIGWRTYHSIQLALNRRFKNGFSLGFADTIGLSDKQQGPLRLQHNADGTVTTRADQAEADRLLGNNYPQTHIMRGNFVWQLPQIKSSRPVLKAVGLIANDWSLSGIWSGVTGAAYTVGFTYQSVGNNANVNLTGSPDYAARVRVVGDPGSGCSSDPYRQFTTSAFQGPLVGSDGLESGSGYVRSCFISSTDLAIARTIRLGGSRSIQLRVDLFNAFNHAGITNRNSTMSLTSPANPVDIQNLPFDANGNLIDARSRPRGAGFGVATNYQAPRTLQLQVRFAF
jgi:Carboxypeptidase regulatory-like domain